MNFLRPLRTLFNRTAAEEDLNREINFPLDKEIEANVRAGMTPEEARLDALRSFGGVAQVQEEVRDAWGVRFFDNLRQDLGYGLRRNPGFALIVILTLGLGIGANPAIFSVVHGALLSPLSYSAPERLYQVEQASRAASQRGGFGFSYTDLVDYRKRTHSFTGLAEYHSMWFILLGRPEPERVQTGAVSANFFGLLGVKPSSAATSRPKTTPPAINPMIALRAA